MARKNQITDTDPAHWQVYERTPAGKPKSYVNVQTGDIASNRQYVQAIRYHGATIEEAALARALRNLQVTGESFDEKHPEWQTVYFDVDGHDLQRYATKQDSITGVQDWINDNLPYYYDVVISVYGEHIEYDGDGADSTWITIMGSSKARTTPNRWNTAKGKLSDMKNIQQIAVKFRIRDE